ncbi:MAG: iron-sulfur cluster assembly scaffold protein [archaeon]|nr:iron-sulfur cluster assembly scaffold protein [archaeon]
MYNKEVIDHFMHPRNMGEIKDADGIGKVGNMTCGDIMWVYVKVGKNDKGEPAIKDIKFKTLGCAAAIASSSMATELAKGKTIDEALNITKEDIVGALGAMPAVKVHCSLLAIEALSEAIYNYLSRNGLPVPEELSKTHERLKIEFEKTKEKYKDFVKSQENFLEKSESG